MERISKKSSQFGLWAATRPHEVGVASNRGSACRGEYVPPVTPWESGAPEVGEPTQGAAAEGETDDWGEVVTR